MLDTVLWWLGAIVAGIGSLIVLGFVGLVAAQLLDKAGDKLVEQSRVWWRWYCWCRAIQRGDTVEQATADLAVAEHRYDIEHREHMAFRKEMKRQFGESIDWDAVAKAAEVE